MSALGNFTRKLHILLASLAVCLSTGCGAPDVPVDGPGTQLDPSSIGNGRVEGQPQTPAWSPGPDSRLTVAEVGGETVTANEVSKFLLSRNPELFQQIVDELVLRQVVEMEARARGIECSAGELERELQADVDREMASAREFLWKRYRVRLEDYLASARLTEDSYRAELRERLQRETRCRILFERLVRYWSLTAEWAEVRRIVVRDLALADELREKILAGASPAVLAKAYCVCPCREDGGKLPRLYRELLDPALAEALFALEPRGISEVVKTGEGYSVYAVLAIQRPRETPYRELESEILASLAVCGIDAHEKQSWYASVLRRLGGVRFPMLPVPAQGASAGE